MKKPVTQFLSLSYITLAVFFLSLLVISSTVFWKECLISDEEAICHGTSCSYYYHPKRIAKAKIIKWSVLELTTLSNRKKLWRNSLLARFSVLIESTFPSVVFLVWFWIVEFARLGSVEVGNDDKNGLIVWKNHSKGEVLLHTVVLTTSKLIY